MAYFLLAVFVVVFCILSYMSFQFQEYELAGWYGLGAIVILLFSAISNFCIKPIEKQRARDRLLEWIFGNKKKILRKGRREGKKKGSGKELSYNGEKITRDTILIRYCIVYSIIVYTKKEFSHYCIKGSSRSYRIGIVCTIFNFLMGWWAIPWGVIYTPQSLYINLYKTESITVGDLIKQL